MGELCTIHSIKTFKKDLKRHFVMAVTFTGMFTVVMAIGALTFFYVEHCYDVVPTELSVFSKSRLHFCNLVQGIRVNQTYTDVGNSSSLLIKAAVDMCGKSKNNNVEALTCQLDGKSFFRWWDYSLTTAYTIGYGKIVPHSRTGRIVTGFYAIPAIGITMAMNIYVGNVFVDGTKILLVLLHTKILRKRIVRNLSMKVFCYQIVVAVVICIIYAEINRRWKFEDLTMTDAIYFSFITLSTIGFGDVYYDKELFLFRADEIIKLLFTAACFFVGMGVMASALTGLSKLFTKEKRKTRRENRFIMKLMKKMYIRRDGMEFKSTLFNCNNSDISIVHGNPSPS